MTRQQTIDNMKTVAYFSGYGGIEIKSIEYGIEDHVIFMAGTFAGKRSAHRARIYYPASGRAYFNYLGSRIHFDECLRV